VEEIIIGECEIIKKFKEDSVIETDTF